MTKNITKSAVVDFEADSHHFGSFDGSDVNNTKRVSGQLQHITAIG